MKTEIYFVFIVIVIVIIMTYLRIYKEIAKLVVQLTVFKLILFKDYLGVLFMKNFLLFYIVYVVHQDCLS